MLPFLFCTSMTSSRLSPRDAFCCCYCCCCLLWFCLCVFVGTTTFFCLLTPSRLWWGDCVRAGGPWCTNVVKCKTPCTMPSSLATRCVVCVFHRVVVARSPCEFVSAICVFCVFLLLSSLLSPALRCAPTGTTRQATAKKLDDKLGFLTPILKGFLSESGVEASNMGIQVYGGHGYIKSNKQEQIARDVRISALWEGTTQIQVSAGGGSAAGGEDGTISCVCVCVRACMRVCACVCVLRAGCIVVASRVELCLVRVTPFLVAGSRPARPQDYAPEAQADQRPLRPNPRGLPAPRLRQRRNRIPRAPALAQDVGVAAAHLPHRHASPLKP